MVTAGRQPRTARLTFVWWLALGALAGVPAARLAAAPVFAHAPPGKLALADAGLPDPAPDTARYVAAFQFGPRTNDVCVLGLDYGHTRRQFRRMYVRVAGHPRYDVPVKFNARRRGKTVEFKPFKLDDLYGDTLVQLRLQFIGEGADLDLDAECLVRHQGGRTARFTLLGGLPAFLGTRAHLEPDPLLGPLRLRLTLDHRSTPPSVSGVIRMNKFSLLPGNGMDRRLRVTVTDADGRVRVKKRLKPDSRRRGYFRYTPRRPFRPGDTYLGSAAIDLGPVLGPLRTEVRLVPRK